MSMIDKLQLIIQLKKKTLNHSFTPAVRMKPFVVTVEFPSLKTRHRLHLMSYLEVMVFRENSYVSEHFFSRTATSNICTDETNVPLTY